MDRYTEQQLASIWNFRFKDAMVHKAPYTKEWQKYWDAYRGDYFKNQNLPDYKSNLVSNYIFSIVETIRPIMLDNDPKFMAMPRVPEGMQLSNDIQYAMAYEWDRERMSEKLYKDLITTLVTGTSVYFLPWDSEDKNIKAISVNPFNIFPDPLATCVEDSEYIIYASYKNVERLKRFFPNKAKDLHGGQINYSELVHENDRNARIDNQVLVLEVWTKDYENENGKLKYPHGRVITLCPELGIVLTDKKAPYQDRDFPFILSKDYDIPGKFWGEGEVAQLLSPQKYMNELNNAILDNAKSTANMPWIIDKNSGIGQGKITARPGLVLRKNPGTEVRREQAPNMPNYVINAVETYKSDIEQISGVFNALKGESATGVYTAQGILALQEAGQARIRLKVKLMEHMLGKLGQMWLSRMKQFWKEDRWLRITKTDGSVDMKKFSSESLKFDYDIKISGGSTMPVNRGAMLDLMIRLAQTQMPDGQTLVDREAVAQYLPEEVKSALLRRMKDNQSALVQIEQNTQQLGQQLQMFQKQLQELGKESASNDEEVFGVIEELTGAVEEVNKQILQLQEEHDRIKEEQEEEEKINKVKTDSYNEGYTDAEKLAIESQKEKQDMKSVASGTFPKNSEQPKDLEEQEGIDGTPDDILEGIEELNDDELALLVEKNPELLELIK